MFWKMILKLSFDTNWFKCTCDETMHYSQFNDKFKQNKFKRSVFAKTKEGLFLENVFSLPPIEVNAMP